MTVVDVMGEKRKNNVMQDTWGHMYPQAKKYDGYMVIAVGEYGDNIIIKSHFDGLDSSPQRYELEHTIFDRGFEVGVYMIQCTLWFYKDCHDMYLGKPVGKIIKVKSHQWVSEH